MMRFLAAVECVRCGGVGSSIVAPADATGPSGTIPIVTSPLRLPTNEHISACPIYALCKRLGVALTCIDAMAQRHARAPDAASLTKMRCLVANVDLLNTQLSQASHCRAAASVPMRIDALRRYLDAHVRYLSAPQALDAPRRSFSLIGCSGISLTHMDTFLERLRQSFVFAAHVGATV